MQARKNSSSSSSSVHKRSVKLPRRHATSCVNTACVCRRRDTQRRRTEVMSRTVFFYSATRAKMTFRVYLLGGGCIFFCLIFLSVVFIFIAMCFSRKIKLWKNIRITIYHWCTTKPNIRKGQRERHTHRQLSSISHRRQRRYPAIFREVSLSPERYDAAYLGPRATWRAAAADHNETTSPPSPSRRSRAR